jgi:hypothetical protein
MSFMSFLPSQKWCRLFSRNRPTTGNRQRRQSCRLELEALEKRQLLTGTWTGLTNLAPLGDSGTMMLLSDGTLMVEGSGQTATWQRLTPDALGSYTNGTWSSIASMSASRLYFGSNILPDGRVFLVGGEYSSAGSFTNTGEIYNPLTNSWASIANFPQSQFGDDPTMVLPDGRVLGGYLSGGQTYIYNPATNTWSATGSKLRGDRSDEETWVKLGDNSILSYDVFNLGHAQRYVPSTGTWVDAGAAPNNLSSSAVGSELGPALSLADGRILYLGATGHTAFYTPSTNTWASGPDIPSGLGCDDAPGAVLANGKVLFAADTPLFHGPTHVFEFDPVANTYTDVTPSIAGLSTSGACYTDRMLMLPTGQVLFTTGGNKLAVYTPDGTALAAGKPGVSSVTLNADGSYTLTGGLLNGISAGASYGDDAEMDSNYPIVQLTDSSNHVRYARTHNWNATGIYTTNGATSTLFNLPTGLAAGNYTLRVIANGNPSNPVNLTVAYHVAFTNPATVTAGTSFAITVTIQDANNNTVTGYTGTVHFVASTGTTANYTFTAADMGTHTFSGLSLRRAGTVTVTGTDTVNPSVTGNTSITVVAAAADHIAFTNPATVTAGTSFAITVTVQDAFNNTVTGYTNTVHFVASTGYTANYTFNSGDMGTHTFSGLVLNRAGTVTVTGTDTVIPAVTGNTSITIVAAPAVAFQVIAPASVSHGTPFSITVIAVDQFGNTDTSYTGTIHFSTTDTGGGVMVPGMYTFQPSDAGMVTFTNEATLATTGNQGITVTDVASLTGSVTITVT